MMRLRGYCFLATIQLLLLGATCSAWNLLPGPSPPTTVTRRNVIKNLNSGLIGALALATGGGPSFAFSAIDVNNAMAREFTAYPGLYPTIATKIVNGAKDEPFRSKKDVYAILSEPEQERLRQYDQSITISKPDKALQQFKTSQICKYECGGRTSSEYRDSQIKAIQAERQLDW